jgi:hypothetical protein
MYRFYFLSDFLLEIVRMASISSLYNYAIDMMVMVFTFGSFLLPPEVQTQIDAIPFLLQSPTVVALFELIAYFMDFFVPWSYFEIAVGWLLSLWLFSLFVRLSLFIYHQFWGAPA